MMISKQANKQKENKTKAIGKKKSTWLKSQKEKVKYPEACLEGVPDTQPITTYFARNAVDLLEKML